MSDQELMTRIISDIMNISDISNLKTIAQSAHSRKDSLLESQTAAWQVTDKVQLAPEFRGRRPYGAVGTIVKINRVKMKVKFDSMTWNVPKTMLVKAE